MLVFLPSASALVSVVFVLGAWENGQIDVGKSEHEHRLRHDGGDVETGAGTLSQGKRRSHTS